MGMGLAGVPGVDGFALDTEGLLGVAVGGDQRAAQDHVWQLVGVGAVEGAGQIWCLSCENLDVFVDVAVGGGAGDAVAAVELADVALAVEPAQHHDRLPERGQGPAAGGGGAQAAFVVQEPGEVVNECTGDVERGTTSNHVEPSG